ncbi:hypothetical protein EG328_004917 [Venturia inaequalis]|uniref:Secreted protein n=1 Tax=Venturia inaequalis TaxID=5025 RepID=A0A8H3YSZ3_VENIN|nr:hypothetical protein EG328_004917 [Venturia inaequalis]
MRFLSILLSAVLFAQSAFGWYYCCFEVRKKNSNAGYQKIFKSDGVEDWYPYQGCYIFIIKAGPSCASWESQVVRGCDFLKPIGHLGVTTANVCPPGS